MTRTITQAALRMRQDQKVVTAERPNRHHNLIAMAVDMGYPTPIRAEQGFLDSDGVFVDRQEAAIIAVAAGQCTELHIRNKLTSEDLW